MEHAPAVAVDEGFGGRALGEDDVVFGEFEVERADGIDAAGMGDAGAVDEVPRLHERAVEVERVFGGDEEVAAGMPSARAPARIRTGRNCGCAATTPAG